jgi:hypothetical protein
VFCDASRWPVFSAEGSTLSKQIIPKAVDFSEYLELAGAETPVLSSAASQVHETRGETLENAFSEKNNTMQLDSPMIPPLLSPDKEYEGPPTPG